MSQAIRSVSGVRGVELDYDAKLAEVRLDRCTEEDFDRVSDALERAGYSGVVFAVTPIGYQPP